MPPLFRRRRRPTLAGALLLLVGALLLGGGAQLCAAHSDSSPSCSFPAGDHHHHHDHDHHHHDHRHEIHARKLPEELAEEEDLELYGFGDHGDHGDHHHHHHHHHSHGESDPELSPIGLWARAMGCSLLVSMASLVCLIILPVIFMQGKPSKTMVDCLAVFGAGAMLGDAFLHQLPHAFGGEHSHAHEHHSNNIHNHQHESGHSHSLKDLSVGLSILSGIVLFLLVEKIVRYVEDHTRNGALNLGHGHHHHHKQTHKLKDDDENHDNSNPEVDNSNDTLDIKSGKKHSLQGESDGCLNDEKHTVNKTLPRQRVTSSGATSDGKGTNDGNDSEMKMQTSNSKSTFPPPSSLVFGYLNLFSDGVHNFTDGMALGSAFLLHGSIGGWSRTLFLLAHEIPQEVGDFGILVRSGFTVTRALFFNFLSALVALAGTALALVLGKDPGQSSLIEGFTAGGFIYIAVAGVLPEMNNGTTTLKSTSIQLISLTLGMAVALCISLIE